MKTINSRSQILRGHGKAASSGGKSPRAVTLQREVVGIGSQRRWQALGKHILLEVYGRNLQLLDDIDAMKTILHQAAVAAETEPLEFGYHRFEPQGISCFLILAESHVSVHTWPQFGYASFDMYTCGGKPEKAIEKIIALMQPCDYECRKFVRGRLENVQRHVDQHFPDT